MKFRFISPTLHGVADYSAGIGLVLAPFILGIGSNTQASRTISIITGIAVLVVSLLTNYKLGVFKRISFQGHLAIDLLVALTFMIIPFALGFEGIESHYYLFNAAVVFTVVSLSENDY